MHTSFVRVPFFTTTAYGLTAWVCLCFVGSVGGKRRGRRGSSDSSIEFSAWSICVEYLRRGNNNQHHQRTVPCHELPGNEDADARREVRSGEVLIPVPRTISTLQCWQLPSVRIVLWAAEAWYSTLDVQDLIRDARYTILDTYNVINTPAF